MIQTSLGAVTFSTDATMPGYTIASLDGWYSGPPVRNIVEDRPNANGAFGVTQIYKGSRVITQTGLILANTTTDAMTNYWQAFAGLQTNGLPSTFTVVDDAGTKTALVTLAGPPEIVPIVGGLAEYSLQLVARDPVKYGPAQVRTTGLPASGGGLEYPLGSPSGALFYGANGDLGRVAFLNAGTAETWPRITVTGGLTSGFFVQCLETGQVVRYDRIVPLGTTVTIDYRTGEVLIDGISDGSTYVTRDEYASLPPGVVRTFQFNSVGASTGTPTLTMTGQDGWF